MLAAQLCIELNRNLPSPSRTTNPHVQGGTLGFSPRIEGSISRRDVAASPHAGSEIQQPAVKCLFSIILGPLLNQAKTFHDTIFHNRMQELLAEGVSWL